MSQGIGLNMRTKEPENGFSMGTKGTKVWLGNEDE